MKRFLHGAKLAIALSASALSATLPSALASLPAQPEPLLLSQSVNFQPPNVTAPGGRQGGTHRGSKLCPAGLSITPLVPPTNIGLTLTESPTIFVYLPQTSAEIEFTLLTENEDKVVYEKTFKVDKSGIVGIAIPASSDSNKSLEVGKRYVWSFSMVCEPEDRSADLVTKGFVQRIEPQPNLKSDLVANPDPMTRLDVYAKNGIWYETLATLAQMRRQTPGDARLNAKWTQLLESQGLESVAAQPLVGPL
ncbi:DUF928 domain-containing protein [Microcoleus sp. herbarium12]|uniref:DUF928 domain-containing protein n=1 Tax=Microcoleus sp. herbarium12 TaxID=3055437 RepID=UPI002FCECA37